MAHFSPYEDPSSRRRRRDARLVLLAVTALAAVLFSWGFDRDRTHPYYTAAVRSMSRSWHDFLFGSFDPAGFITTDKLPGAFWVQAASVRVFGFHPWSVLLPQVLAGVACVPLLYLTVRRWAGMRAGLIAALVYALTPVTVALARTNIPDALMVFFLVLAADAFWRWTVRTPGVPGVRGPSWWLAVSAAWLGVAFHVKMGQALLVVPVFVGVCQLAGSGRRGRRLGRAALFGGLTAAASLVWMVFVTLTPAGRRPYIDGSLHDSVWEMVFQYNGFGRLGGQQTGANPLAGGGVLVGMGGSPGPGRLFGPQTAGQISWLIPAALLALAVGLAGRPAGPGDPAPARRLGRGRLTPDHLGWLFWGGWLAVYAAAFCLASGIHSYYTSSLAPPIAALAGTGLAVATRGRVRLLAAYLGLTGAWAFAASLETPHWQPWLRWTVAGCCVLALALLAWARMVPALRPVTAVAGAVALFAAPAVWTGSVLTRRSDPMGSIAAAAGPPQQLFGHGHHGAVTNAEIAAGLKAFSRGPDPAVTGYLAAHRGTSRFAAAVETSMGAAAYLARGLPVLPMGGFTGDAPAPTVAGLAAMVRSGEVRYAVLGGARTNQGRKTDAREVWIRANCRVVPGLGSGGAGAAGSPATPALYDCGPLVR